MNRVTNMGFIIRHPLKTESAINLQPQFRNFYIISITLKDSSDNFTYVLTSNQQQGIWLISVKLILPHHSNIVSNCKTNAGIKEPE